MDLAMQPFNPRTFESFHQQQITPKNERRIVKFTGAKEIGTERRGLFQSSRAKAFGRAVHWYQLRSKELEAKLPKPVGGAGEDRPNAIPLRNRRIKVIDSARCHSLLQSPERTHTDVIQQAEVDVLEAIMTNNLEGLAQGMTALKQAFQDQYGDRWAPEFKQFLATEVAGLQVLSRRHSQRRWWQVLLRRPVDTHQAMFNRLKNMVAEETAQLNS